MITSNPLCHSPIPEHCSRKDRLPAAQRLAMLRPMLFCLGLLLPSISSATILPTPTVTGSSAPLSGIYLGSWAVDQGNTEFVTTQGVGTFLEFDLGAVQAVDGFVNVTLVDPGRQIGANRLIFDTDGTPGFNAATDTVRSFTQAQTGSLGQGIIQRFDAVSARYARWEVQAVVAAPTLIGMTEVAFLGTQSGSKPLPVAAVAVIGSAPAASAQFAAANAANGVAGIAVSGGASGIEYASNAAGANTYVDFDLGATRPILGFDLFDRINPGDRTTGFDLIFSNSPTFSPVIATKSYSKATKWTATDNFAAVNARYVRYDVTSGGSYAGLGEMTFYYPEIPAISLLGPASGSRLGGTTVTLTGLRFNGTTLVTFDGIAATSVNVINDTTLTCITPAHAVGTVHVEVTTPSGTGNRKDFYTYINPAPTNLAIDASSIEENSPANSVVGVLSATDDAGDTHTFTLVAGAGSTDNASFLIPTNNNRLRIIPSPDFETKNSYDIRVRATDTGGGFVEKRFTISISNVNDAPVITSDGGGATAALSYAENNVLAAVGIVQAADADTGQSLTYSIVPGGDAAWFAINATSGLLIFVTAPDYEGTHGITYTVTVKATDNDAVPASDTQVITVTILNTNDAPTISSIGDQGIVKNTSTGAVAFTVADADAGSVLTVTASSNNLTLLPQANIALGGSGTNRTISLTPLANAIGAATITVQVSDGGLTASRVFRLVVRPSDGYPQQIRLFNTGVDNNNVVLPDGAVDPHYILTTSANPAAPIPDAHVISTPYFAPTADSKWISPAANATSVAGDYVYTQTFDLSSANISTLILVGRWACDNDGTIFLNGNAVPGSTTATTTGFYGWKNFSIDEGFLPGINTLEFRVRDAGGYTGMRAEITAVGLYFGDAFKTYSQWTTEMTALHPGMGGLLADASADPDHDGSANMMEFYFSTDPLSGGSMPPPLQITINQQPDPLTGSVGPMASAKKARPPPYPRPPKPPIVRHPHRSASPGVWLPTEPLMEPIKIEVLPGGTVVETFLDPVPLSAAQPKAFYRLEYPIPTPP